MRIWWCGNAYLVMRICVIGRPLAAVGADLSCPHIRKHTRNGEGKCVFGNANMCNWQCQDTGTMNRSPTPGGMFAPHFVGVRWVFAECSQRNWQTVSSCRGPIYRAHVYVNAHEMGDEYAYLIMWKCVCDNANVRIWWIGYIYMVMWNVHAVKWRHRFENEKNMDSVIRMPDLVMRICVIGNVRIQAR